MRSPAVTTEGPCFVSWCVTPSLLPGSTPTPESGSPITPCFATSSSINFTSANPVSSPTSSPGPPGWHLAEDDLDTAVTYLLAAENWDAAIELIHSHGWELFKQGRPNDLLGWIDAMPAGAMATSPRRALEHASVQTMVGNTLAAQEIIRQLARTHSLSPEEQVVADGLAAGWVQFHAPPDSVARACRSVMRILDEAPAIEPVDVFGLTSRASLRVIALGSHAIALWHAGHVEEAQTALKALAESDDTAELWKVSVLGALALLEAWSGRLRLAEHYASQAIASVGLQRPDPETIDAQLAMAHVLRERNRLRQAGPFLDRAQALATATQRSVSLAVLAGERALLNLAEGQPVAGLRCVTTFRVSGHPPPPFAIESRLRAIEGHLLLEIGRDAQADLVIDGAGRRQSPEMTAVALQAAVARRDIQTAGELLRGWPNERRDLRSELMHGLWTAIVEEFKGGRRDTLDQLARVASLAEPEGHARLFLDAGDDAVRLLRRLLRTRPTAYLRSLVHPEALPTPSRPAEAVAVMESLTERELLVLQYVPSRLSNSEMASHLYVSTNTVKTHLRSIYQKLGVSGRKEAAKKAEQLGLV